MPEKLLDLRAVADYIGVTYGTAKTYKSAEVLPDPTRYEAGTSGGKPKPLWSRTKIDKWQEERKQ